MKTFKEFNTIGGKKVNVDSLQEAYLEMVGKNLKNEGVNENTSKEQLDESASISKIVDGFAKIEKELNKLHLSRQNIPFKSSDKLPPTMRDEKSKYFQLTQEFESNLSRAEILASKINSFIRST